MLLPLLAKETALTCSSVNLGILFFASSAMPLLKARYNPFLFCISNALAISTSVDVLPAP